MLRAQSNNPTSYAILPGSTIGTAAAGIAPSGTIGTGASGNITLGGAIHRIFTEGIWLYLPTIATTPAITEGMYWVVMSSTTVGTVYASGPGSAAINFTVGASYTGVTGTTVTLSTVTLPANTLTAGCVVQAVPQYMFKSSSGTKTLGSFYGTSQFWQSTATTNASDQVLVVLRGLTAAKQAGTANSSSGTGNSPNSPAIITEDATVSKTVTFTGSLNTATDYLIMDGIHYLYIRPQ